MPQHDQQEAAVAAVLEAEQRLSEAFRAYRDAAALTEVLGSPSVAYAPSKALRDDRRYTIDLQAASRFHRDPGFVRASDATGDDGSVLLEAAKLSVSPHWQDRVRAEALLAAERRQVVLPDGFPAIYEAADSPNKSRDRFPTSTPWVVSPDEQMLAELLPLYQELWDSYTSQWGSGSRRVFAVGRLDGLSPRGAYRPGTTPEQVIGQTMITHSDMYRRAPLPIKEMHPLHASWEASRRQRLDGMRRAQERAEEARA